MTVSDWRGPSMEPLGAFTVACASTVRTSSMVRPMEARRAGSTCTRTEGVCWPPISTWLTPVIWLICWLRMFSA